MKTTKPENVRLLIAHLKSLPNGKSSHSSLMDLAVNNHPTCGTVGCIAGEAYRLQYLHRPAGLAASERIWNLSWPSIAHSAEKWLGLWDGEGHSIFHVNQWPEDLYQKYRVWARTPRKTLKGERALMIKRLERLLKA
jgi:hypothetical protein